MWEVDLFAEFLFCFTGSHFVHLAFGSSGQTDPVPQPCPVTAQPPTPRLMPLQSGACSLTRVWGLLGLRAGSAISIPAGLLFRVESQETAGRLCLCNVQGHKTDSAERLYPPHFISSVSLSRHLKFTPVSLSHSLSVFQSLTQSHCRQSPPTWSLKLQLGCKLQTANFKPNWSCAPKHIQISLSDDELASKLSSSSTSM